MNKHVLVWVDHKQAHVFSIQAENTEESTITAPLHNIHHKHPRGPGEPKAHPDDAKRFFHEVVGTLAAAEEVLIVGPGTAKLELLKYVHKHDHALEPKIVGIETVDHPTGPQLVAYAKTYFKASERMR